MQPPIVVIGGGLAGLACVGELVRQNQPVLLFEASDWLGGRVRTDIVEGYRIERGGPVVPEAYPALADAAGLQELDLRRFDPGVLIWDGTSRQVLENPLRSPGHLPGVLRSRVVPLADLPRLAKLAALCRFADWNSAAAASVTREGSGSTRQLLEERGFSRAFSTRVARPLWGGLLLDPSLSLSAGPVLFMLKMLMEGAMALPAEGMQALPAAMAVRFPEGTTRLGSPVEQIVIENGQAIGIVTRGDQVPASAVVVATDGPAASALTGIDAIPVDGIGCTTVYLAGTRDPGIGKSLLLNGSGFGGVNHLVPLSNVAPSYAPPGNHLIAAVLPDTPDVRGRRPESLVQLARSETARMLGQGIEDWDVVTTVTTPFAHVRQAPGFVAHLPRNRTGTRGLYLAGEYTVDSSINGALQSGVHTAHAILRDRGILTA